MTTIAELSPHDIGLYYRGTLLYNEEEGQYVVLDDVHNDRGTVACTTVGCYGENRATEVRVVPPEQLRDVGRPGLFHFQYGKSMLLECAPNTTARVQRGINQRKYSTRSVTGWRDPDMYDIPTIRRRSERTIDLPRTLVERCSQEDIHALIEGVTYCIATIGSEVGRENGIIRELAVPADQGLTLRVSDKGVTLS